MTTTTNTLALLRTHLNNDEITINAVNEVRIEGTHQTLGIVFETEADVVEHLRTLTLDNDAQWEGVDSAELYNEPNRLSNGLFCINGEVWYQSY